MPDLVDTHCHLDQYPDPAQVAAAAEHAGVAIIAVTRLPSHYAAGVHPVRAMRGVRLALGLHPLLAPHAPGELAAFRRYAKTTSYIGEVGLDFSHHGRHAREAQMESFRVVIDTLHDLARAGQQRFVTIHSRGAERVLLDALAESELGPAVLHWYTGPLATVDRAVALGCYFSVNPAMLLAQSGRRLLGRVPPERVLFETDGPYVSIGRRPAQPTDLRKTVHDLSAVWGLTGDAAAAQVRANLRALLGALGVQAATRGTTPP